TEGRGPVKPTVVGQASPPTAVRAEGVPITRSAAGAIGIAARAPPDSPGPSVPPAGAVLARPSGRSAGVNTVRCTASAYPAALLLTTVTRSEIGAGVSPE